MTNPEFRTKDIGIVATLLEEKYHLIDLDRTKSSVEFIFEDSDALQRTLGMYLRDELRLPAQSLLLSFRKAKRLLYDYQS